MNTATKAVAAADEIQTTLLASSKFINEMEGTVVQITLNRCKDVTTDTVYWEIDQEITLADPLAMSTDYPETEHLEFEDYEAAAQHYLDAIKPMITKES